MEATARQMIAKSADPHIAYPVLAGALASKGDPLPTVREALFHAAKQLDALPKATADRVRDRLLTTGLMRAAELAGDFDEALAQARILEGRTASSPRRNDHGVVARDIAAILLETDKRAEAGRVALDYLDRQDAWEPDPSAEDIALASDATPALLVIARRAGVLSREKAEARRKAWLAAWSSRVTPVARSYLWLHGFAATTLDADDARAALEAQGTYGPAPPFVPQTMAQASAGLAFFLTGHIDEAKTWLEQSCRSCAALSFPIEHTRAHLWLGRVREASGDVPGACAAYEIVLSRWGHAKPRSVSADEARERASKLGCARR
jgi:serine/threonine-protein kinase